MQVTIKHCLPWGSFNVQTFNLDLNVDVNFLQDLISAKFNISNKDQILKYRRDGLTFKLIPGWSLAHYGLTDKAVIYLEKRQGPNEQQAHNQELMNIKMKQDYFVRLGIVKKEDEEESMEHYRMSSLLSCDGSLLDQAINSKNTGRLTYDGHYAGKRDTVSLQRLAVSVVGEDNSIESLIKEVKANNLGKVMKTLIGVSDKTMSLTKFPEKEETIEVKAKRIINQKGINGWSAFHWAVFLGHIDLVAEFLNLGADINSQTDDGWTPLQLSIYKDHMEGTKLLLNQPGININAVTSRGAALHVASNTGRLQLISLLLENGADINVKTKEGQTPYEMATKEKIKNLFKANLLRTRAETRASEAPKPVLVKGWLYKKKKRFPTFKKKFFALNPIQGTLIGYKTEESYPNKPIYIIALNEVTVIRKKNPEILFDKRLTYMKIETKNENYILGCFNKDTIEKWMDHLEKAHEYTSMHDERFKQAMLHKSSTYSVMNSVMTAESGLEEVVINDFKNKSPMKEPATQRDSEERKKQHDIRTPELSSKNASLVAKEKITLSSFKILKEIGSGSFGKVYKAKKKDTGKIYALKVLEKWSLIMKNQIHCAVAEANILKKIKHPFIVTLHYTFQTSDHLFLVMDYCPGGDLNTHLCNRGVFNEQEARLIIAELLLAVEHLHSMDVLYRDLKPENILVDGDGHIQLTDFGLSKEGVNNGDVAKSFCGSPAYLAPEMLSSKGVSRMADIYGIGTVLYELLVGKPPYYSNDINQLYKKIQKGSITLPHDLSKEAKCFITKLLDRNPGKRIGAYDKAEIRRDPFFNGINWEQVAQRRLPPINPSLCKESQNHSMFTKMKPLLCEYDHASDEELENHIKGFSFIRENCCVENPLHKKKEYSIFLSSFSAI